MTQNKEVIHYKDLQELVNDLNAEDKGRYFLCDCPSCGRSESFIYKDNPFFIKCNRVNNCGFESIIKYDDNEKTKEKCVLSKKENTKDLNEKQLGQIEWLSKFLSFYQKNYPNPSLENGYRGISKEVIQPYAVDLVNEKMMKWFFKRTDSLYPDKEHGKRYYEMSVMTARNLVFPIKGEDGLVDVICLRSTGSKNVGKKEIQLYLNPSSAARDFIVDIPDNCSHVVVCESPLDALSFKEIDSNIGFIGLTGSNKLSKALRFICENKDLLQQKTFLLAGDNDRAGKEMNKKINSELDKLKIRHTFFEYQGEANDPNEFLNKDRSEFEKNLEQSVKNDFIHFGIQEYKNIIFASSFREAEKLKEKKGLKEAGIIALTAGNATEKLQQYLINQKDLLKGKSFFIAAEDIKNRKQLNNLLQTSIDEPLIKNMDFKFKCAAKRFSINLMPKKEAIER
ncbi:toprim domain-containing protein [Bacillus licheniformis]|uniref:toprim domain-containing protein n=1 Tax=Bacillus licheniformis TaxID=1402 RepID=UPI0011A18FEF|nr:toprim domain-containing protein [Bacillus licheniformis]TWL14640.1 hypothetical protein CHCC16874_1684 [Bacillus licheniformis]